MLWTLRPDDHISRVKLHEQFGGRTQGGIGPSRTSPNIFIFTDAKAGEQHGYIDGWQNDGCFHYTGEGQYGDQQMKSGNRSIIDHRKDGRALRLFQGARGTVRYIDEFVLDNERPYYTADAPETNGGPTRSVIVFRLRPKTIEPHPPDSRFAAILQQAFFYPAIGVAQPTINEIAIEEQRTEATFVNPRLEPTEAERREAKLVTNFRDFLQSRGVQVIRHQIIPIGEAKPIFTDLYVKNFDILIEAKGSVERGSIRMALGQLLDYHRFLPHARRAILLPNEPRPDLMNLILHSGVGVYWPEGETFVQTFLAGSERQTDKNWV